MAMAGLVGLLLVVVAATYHRYGFTVDDVRGVVRAIKVYNFLQGGADHAEAVAATPFSLQYFTSYVAASGHHAGDFHHTNFYGALPDLTALVLQKTFPILSWDSRHLVAALFGVVGVFYCYRLGGHVAGAWAGVCAALFLSLNPMWFGYMFINIKDIPFAAMLLAASYYGLRVLADEQPPPPSTWIGLGIATGALAATKIVGLLFLAVTVFVLVAFTAWERRRLDLWRLLARSAFAGLVAILGCVLFCAIFWPQLFLYSPLDVLRATATFLDFSPYQGRPLLNGLRYDQAPRSYLLTYIAISTPLSLMALYLISFVFAFRSNRLSVIGVSLLPVFFVAAQAMTQSPVYNGYRHVLFIVPFMMIGAGFAFVKLAAIGEAIASKVVAALVLAFIVGSSIFTTTTLFPYQYSAYNSLVGGLSGAQGRYDVDIWRSAHREALRVLDKIVGPEGRYVVESCGSQLDNAEHPRFKRIDKWSDFAGVPDYVIATSSCRPSEFPGYTAIAEVRRGDVVFATILAPSAEGAPG